MYKDNNTISYYDNVVVFKLPTAIGGDGDELALFLLSRRDVIAIDVELVLVIVDDDDKHSGKLLAAGAVDVDDNVDSDVIGGQGVASISVGRGTGDR